MEEEGPCAIDYTFNEPHDMVDIQVAFWKWAECIRTLKVSGKTPETLFLPSTSSMVGLTETIEWHLECGCCI